MSNIKSLRLQAGMTQEELATKIGVTQGAVWQWENSDVMPRTDKLLALAAALHCTVNELLAPPETKTDAM